MFQIIVFVVYITLCLNNVYAVEDENFPNAKAFEAFMADCFKEYGVTLDDLSAAKTKGNLSNIKSCFWSCYFKKFGFINDKGEYDPSVYEIKLPKDVPDRCKSLKDVKVSDGEAGCERGALLAECLASVAP